MMKWSLGCVVIFAGVLFFVSNNSSAQTTVVSEPYSRTVNLSTSATGVTLPSITCVDLSYDLYQGLGDKGTDRSILNLQNYLLKNNYLLSTPNGYFGPATLSAVKRYQLDNGISSTGRVGPITRKKIRDNSCNSNNNTASVINSIPSPTPKPGRINNSNLTVSYPTENSTHVTDTKIKIRWNGSGNNIYGLILEDKDGIGVGHITSSVLGDSYEWVVGKVYSARTNSEIVVEPGLYRVRLIGAGYSLSIPEQYSGLFTIQGKPLEIDSITPSSIRNDNDSSVVIFGRGFDNTTMVNFDVNNNGRVVKPTFVSSDGKVLVFTASSFIRPLQYSVTVNNKYDSGATSTPSNAVTLLVNGQ